MCDGSSIDRLMFRKWRLAATQRTRCPNGWTNPNWIWWDTRLICIERLSPSHLHPSWVQQIFLRPYRGLACLLGYLPIFCAYSLIALKQKNFWQFLPKMGGLFPTWLQAMGLTGSQQLLFYNDDKLQWVMRSTDSIPQVLRHVGLIADHTSLLWSMTDPLCGISFGRWHHGSQCIDGFTVSKEHLFPFQIHTHTPTQRETAFALKCGAMCALTGGEECAWQVQTSTNNSTFMDGAAWKP